MNLRAKWKQYCSQNGIFPEGAASLLGLDNRTYNEIMEKKLSIPEMTAEKMMSIIDNRDIAWGFIIKTQLLTELEKIIRLGKTSKVMITATAPTGQGKTLAARYLAAKYNARYYHALTELQKEKKATVSKLISDLSASFGLRKSNERKLIEQLRSDTRNVLIIDESQRLITEDWGYFKVMQDIFDSVPNLSVLMLGNFRFYDAMFTSSETVTTGVTDDEQFLRRISSVVKLPRLSAADVKLYCNYNRITFRSDAEYKQVADFFGLRAGLADMETVRKEIVRNVLGKGKRKSLADISYADFIAVFKKLHSHIAFGEEEKKYFRELANA